MTGRFILAAGMLMLILSPVFSEDVIMEVKPNPVRKGYQFNVTLYVDHDKPSEVTVSQPEIPGEFKLVRGPAVKSYYVRLENGGTKKKTRIRYTFLSKKTGRYVLESYKIKAGEKEYFTDPVIIGVGIYKDKRFYIPYEVSWKEPEGPFYVGQAVPLTGQVVNLPEIIIFEKVDVPSPSSGIFTVVDDPGPITKRRIGKETLYSVPVAGYIYTPSGKGSVKIPGIRVEAGGIVSYSRTMTLKIKDLPRDVQATGAIGTFTRNFSLEETSAGIGEGVKLRVVVEGTGNLNYLEIPAPEAENMILSGVKDEQVYTGTVKGYTGKREKVFTLVSSEAGEKNIVIPPFPYLDPATDSIITIPQAEVSVKILNSVSGRNDDPFSGFLPENISVSQLPVKSGRYKNPESYLWLLPGPLVFIIFFAKTKRKILFVSIILLVSMSISLGAQSVGDKGSSLYMKGEYRKALDVYLTELKKYPSSSVLYYNAALCYNRLGIRDKAVYAADTAVLYNPLNDKYSRLAEAIEADGGIDYSVRLKKSIYPDIYLFLMTIAVNAAAFAGVIYLVRRKNFFLILSVLLFAAGVVTAGALIHSAYQWSRHYGIISRKSREVKKIPHEESEPGFKVKEGEMVRVIGSSGDYLFIENGLGLKGWLTEDSLLLLGGDLDPLKALIED